jgi:hypothetical protein
MTTLCDSRSSKPQSKHKLHWSPQTLTTTVCLAHLLCTSLFHSALAWIHTSLTSFFHSTSAWIHTSLSNIFHPRSYTAYTSSLSSNSRDMFTTVVPPPYTLLYKPLPSCVVLMKIFYCSLSSTSKSENLPSSYPPP